MNWLEGKELLPLVRGPLHRDHLRDYASASGDLNPIHLEEAFAKQAGYPSVIVHGMLSMAFLADALRQNFPFQDYRVKRLSSRFKKITFPGDQLEIKDKVKKIDSEGVWVLLWIENQKKEVTTQGEALVEPLSS